jgi:hypothetical protein
MDSEGREVWQKTKHAEKVGLNLYSLICYLCITSAQFMMELLLFRHTNGHT